MTATSPDFSFYINDRNVWLNGSAVAYALIGYGFGIFCITQQTGWVNLIGIILITHTLLWSAYLVHELIHGNLFQRSLNHVIAQILLFLTGSCYSQYRAVASLHLAHHKHRADFASFSIANYLNSLPKPILNWVVTLEWLYFPIVEFGLRWMVAISPFLEPHRRDERLKNTLLLLLRGGLFIALALYSAKAVVLYFVAYISFINILRFVDCFQHTYEVFQFGEAIPQFDLAYEEANTFSNLVSARWSWLNLLLLNFSYHNAHHRVMRCPWYLLPQLDAELYPRDYRQYVTLAQLVRNFHQFRVDRLFGNQGAVIETENGVSLEQFVGAVGVSFLVAREPLDWLKQPVSKPTNPATETA
ncbi:fatty acid desaturase [filamentous cyanobacterium CCP1]|nr:fatty acid desaturase [filamentous cyanobacterium CCP2]PSB67277.1 fatty acid desaturase [filamentous cyanobacterium CCP1]